MKRRSTVLAAIALGALTGCGGAEAGSPDAHAEDASGSVDSAREAGPTGHVSDARAKDRSIASGDGSAGADGPAEDESTDSTEEAATEDNIPGDLITNGNFSAGEAKWGVTVQADHWMEG